MAITFARPALIRWSTNPLSDHNRSELDIKPKRITNDVRTATGTLRRYWVADKREFSWSWEDLPALDAETVDGFYGAESIISFFNSNPGSFTMTLVDKSGGTENVTVMFTDFSYEIVKRWETTYYYDISVSLEEV